MLLLLLLLLLLHAHHGCTAAVCSVSSWYVQDIETLKNTETQTDATRAFLHAERQDTCL
jgi:hypothetical protein